VRAAPIVSAAALAIVAGLTALAYADYRRDLLQALERISTGSQIARTPCGPIEYADAGAGPAVLLVHGAGGGYDQAIDFVEPLVSRGLRVIRMSRFGYLRTPLPADASAAAPMKTPAGTQFLFDTALRSDFLFWAAIRFARKSVLGAILATPPAVVKNASPGEQARVGRLMERILPVSPRRLGLLNDAAVTSSLPRYALERIFAPALVISLADDLFGTFDGARYSAQHLPRARFIGYPSGGHVWVGHNEQVMAEISGFLK
jgi:2-hydroxy-6-oxonona-2,4-dienedioate hydrolase